MSANPTGPLHVGHGRQAAYGATLADLLAATGTGAARVLHQRCRPADGHPGRQHLAALPERCGEDIAFPSNGYRGDYVQDIAAALYARRGVALHRPAGEVLGGLPPDAPAGDKEVYIDALIERMRS